MAVIAPSAINIPNLAYIKSTDPMLYEALIAIRNAIPTLNLAAPPPVASMNVTASGGVFDITITDLGNPQKGVGYFLEWSLTAAFDQPHVIDLGASRSYRGYLGNQTLYWRAYSQYMPPLNSPPSPPLIFTGNPVAGGGSAGPTPNASTGSGTGAINGQQGGSGYGLYNERQS